MKFIPFYIVGFFNYAHRLIKPNAQFIHWCRQVLLFDLWILDWRCPFCYYSISTGNRAKKI